MRPEAYAESKLMRVCGYALFTITLGCFLSLARWITSGNPYPGWLTDSFFYLLLADFYSGHATGHIPELSSDFYVISRFPPLFPLALALGGGGLEHWSAAYIVTLGFGFISIATTFLWLRQQTGYVSVAAALLPLAILSPQFFFLHLEILSESQFIFLITIVLWATHLCEQRKCSLLTVAALTCLVPLSRTAGLSMSVAVSVWILQHKGDQPRRTRVLALAVVWLIPLLWILHRRRYPVAYDYLNDLAGPARSGVLNLLMSLPSELQRIFGGYAAWFDIHAGYGAAVVAGAVLVLAIAGWGDRVRLRKVDAFFLLIYLSLVLIWPYPFETARLLSITMPMVALYSWIGLNLLLRVLWAGNPDYSTRQLAAGLLLTLALAGSGPKWIDILRRINQPFDQQLASGARTIGFFLAPAEGSLRSAETVTRFIEIAKALPPIVGTKECVWTSFYLQTGFFSSFKVKLKVTPKEIASVDDAKAKLQACRYLLVVDLVNSQVQQEPLYPADFVSSARPVLVSRLSSETGGPGRTSAALLDLKDWY